MDDIKNPNLSDEELDDIFDNPSPNENNDEMKLDDTPNSSNEQAEKIEFPDFGSADTTPSGTSNNQKDDGDKNMDLLFDIPMVISVELGRTKRSLKEILNLSIGSIVELEKLSGEPVDLLVNGKVIAKAEVVVIDENFGIRITQILEPNKRIK